jgi:hypothetical protein
MTILPLPTTDEPTQAGTREGERIVALLRASDANGTLADIRSALPAKLVEAKAALQLYLDHEAKVMQWCGRYWLAVYVELETYFAGVARSAR